MKMRLRIDPDRIFGRGGSVLTATLGEAGEGWGTEHSAEDMVNARRVREEVLGGK